LEPGQHDRLSIGVRSPNLESSTGGGDNDCGLVRTIISGYVPDYRINKTWLLT
jgi:hypothetical protein